MSAAEAVTDALRELHTRFAGLRDGQLADYIPQLALADPDAFGLALISMDGHCYSTGDADAPFTMQSVSKPFVYALDFTAVERVLYALDEARPQRRGPRCWICGR
ncbi:glutaminase [Streptomyces sp. Ncost-T10-10d]|nr:glutaminase [Streptomyces sp. Ncost-T10-10d]SCF78451.1 glutaminase [Streptomyces sp. Ncost-T10-10d]